MPGRHAPTIWCSDAGSKTGTDFSLNTSATLVYTMVVCNSCPVCVNVFFNLPCLSAAYTLSDRRSFQGFIIDYRSRLNPRYEKIERKKTKYIIVHTSELGREMTLRVVSKGKCLRNGRRTPGGHAHYVIARDGRTYRMMNKKYVADHAGLSMWNGETDISKISIGTSLEASIDPLAY